jgi:hypothetical protein
LEAVHTGDGVDHQGERVSLVHRVSIWLIVNKSCLPR